MAETRIEVDNLTWVVEEIHDTRSRDGNFKPIPGSGDARECECCGRIIEVHAMVAKRDGSQRAVIGTMCCKKANLRNGMYEASNKSYWKLKLNNYR